MFWTLLVVELWVKCLQSVSGSTIDVVDYSLGGDVALYNAEQSSTLCYNDGTCYDASRAIDENWGTGSYTQESTGTHWWQASMSETTVYQVELEAQSGTDEEISVSLYSGETLAGHCQSHSGRWKSKETLECDKVAADRVKLTVTNVEKTQLLVYEIKVTGVISHNTTIAQGSVELKIANRGLITRDIKAGSSVVIKCSLKLTNITLADPSDPNNVEWYKWGKVGVQGHVRMVPSDRVQINKNKGTYRLYIKSTTVADSGSYRCRFNSKKNGVEGSTDVSINIV